MSVKPGMVFISLKYSSSFISSYKKSTLAKPEHSRILNISLAYSLILSFVSFFRSGEFDRGRSWEHIFICFLTDVELLNGQLLLSGTDNHIFLPLLLMFTFSSSKSDKHLVFIVVLFGVFIALLRAEHICTWYKKAQTYF